MAEKVLFRIRRQEKRGAPSYVEEFEIRYRPGLSVAAALIDIQRDPVNRAGKRVPPVAFEANCLEEACGACTVTVNGRVRQACSTFIDEIEKPVLVEPLGKFPVVRDLVVDRSSIFEGLRRLKAWVPIDGSCDVGPGPRISKAEAERRQVLSDCTACGSCMEACPSVNRRSPYLGPASINQAVLAVLHPVGREGLEDERLRAMAGPGGIQGCGNAQNCVEVCPKGIPLTWSIAAANREVTKAMFRKWFARSG